jgi:polyhydroxyalkanoate synthesis regulator protein
MENLTREQQKLRDQMAQTFGPKAFHAMEEQVRANMAFFTEAMRMFTPFAQRGEGQGQATNGAEPSSGDLDTLKRQMADMQAKLEALSRK